MFGGEFGAFRSRQRHFFNEDIHVYGELAKILTIRANKIALRRGRQYLRQISGDGEHFDFPHMLNGEIRSVVPWSRIFDDAEMLLAINTHPDQPRTAWVVVDNDLHSVGDHFTYIYSTDTARINQLLTVEVRGGAKAVLLTVPPAGFVIYEPLHTSRHSTNR
jgi:hypothetical protein